MLYGEIIAVCSEIHTKHANTLCGQNVAFLSVKPGGALSKGRSCVSEHSLSVAVHTSNCVTVSAVAIGVLWIAT